MQTRLSRWCESVIEAGWLAALIIVPLFFNVFSARVFEPDKLSLLRSIALVMCAAWLAKWVETLMLRAEASSRSEAGSEAHAGVWARLRRAPLVSPTLILVIAYIISTALSLAPRISWWGSYQRLQGTYTTMSYIVIFFLVLGHLRRREQLHRLIHVIILTSLPISIYGIVQRAGLDPLPWGGDVTIRVASNMGNSIFVAAYLIMAFFLTMERLLRSAQGMLSDDGAGLADAVSAGCYFFVIVAQFLCIFYTQSRGPWLGLLGGLYIFVLLVLITLRRRKLWLSWIGVSILGMVFLIAINIPGTPLSGFRDLPYVGRLAQVFEMDSGTGRVRTLIWEGAVDMIVPHEPLTYPDDGEDRFNALRPLFGHGPEAMWMAYNRFYRPDLAHYEARNASPDRSHNETFDALVMTGYFGFAAYLSLFTSLFYFSLRWLGAIRTRSHLWLFLGLWFGLGVASVVGFRVADGTWRLSGVALPAGMMLGFVVYVTLAAFRRGGITEGSISRRLLIVTLLSTIVAHFIEIHFGIAIAATRTYFWTLAAVLVVIGMEWLPLHGPAAPAASSPAIAAQTASKRRRRRQASRQRTQAARSRPAQAKALSAVLVYALLASVLCFVLVFDYVHNDQKLPGSGAFEIFWNSLTSRVVGSARVTDLAIVTVTVGTWIVGMLLALASVSKQQVQEHPGEPSTWLVPAGVLYSLMSLGTLLVYGLIQGARLRPAMAVPDYLANHISVFYTGALVLLALLGSAIWWHGPLPLRRWSSSGWASALTGAVATAVAIVAISLVNVSLVKADVYYKMGQNFDNAGQWENSIALHTRALELAGEEDFYLLFRGRAELELAKQQADPASREAWLQASLDDLTRARELNPLNTDHTANLGRLYRGWGELTSDSQERIARWEQSLEYYEQAIRLSPMSAHLYNEYGMVLQALGDNQQAEEMYQKSLALDQMFDQTYLLLGELYRIQEKWDQAEGAYAQLVQLRPRSVQGHSGLGYIHAQQGKLAEAITDNQKVLELAPTDLASTRNLALLHRQAGELDQALEYARRARDLSPDNEKPQLDLLISEIEEQLR